MPTKNTIKIKNYSDVIEEYVATAVVISPGMLLEITSGALVQAHSTSEGDALPMFALENELEGETVTDDYIVSDTVQCWIPGRGDIVFGRLANGETAVIGSFLSSNGDGRLKVHATGSAAFDFPLGIVGQALEAVDMSDSSLADPDGFIQLRIA